jgi:orotidine-5'-phosphate decarboxylase
MISIVKAREAARQAGEQYGRQVAELSSLRLTSAPAHDAGTAYIRPVSQHIDKQAGKLRGKGMDAELVQLWAAAAMKAATERLKEHPLVTDGHKRSRHRP